MTHVRMKSVLTLLVLAVTIGLVPSAHAAATVKAVIAGSSAMWQALALGAYNGGSGVSGTVPVLPLYHWTSGTRSLALQDARPVLVGGVNLHDAATVWIVWDSATTGSGGSPNIWLYAKVDSVVGDRCFFASPACTVVDFLNPTTNADWKAAGANQIQDPCSAIPGNLWGDGSCDTQISAAPNGITVLAVLEQVIGTMAVNSAATDIRPEDAYFAVTRANSALGNNSFDPSHSDGLDGLGYNQNNPASTAINEGSPCVRQANPSQFVGTPVYSSYGQTGTSQDFVNVASFNLSGFDPITCNALPTYVVENVGVAPIVFVNGRQNSLANLQNATEAELQQAFSGANADASAFGLPPASIDVYLHSPTSGAMNIAEADVFRYPTLYSSTLAGDLNVQGLSQEAGVGIPAAGTVHNPLQLGSAGTGLGFRYRALGLTEAIQSVAFSTTAPNPNSNHVDGITYAPFSVGDLSLLADNGRNVGYLNLNGTDPIFLSYSSPLDPRHPHAASGTIPSATDFGLPACENKIWLLGLSFPSLRPPTATYPAWNIFRLAYRPGLNTDILDLIKSSNTYDVAYVPNYIPFAKVVIPGSATSPCGTVNFVEPGFSTIVRSHYQQRDGNDNPLGGAAINLTVGERGGDMGGAILPYPGVIQLVQTPGIFPRPVF